MWNALRAPRSGRMIVSIIVLAALANLVLRAIPIEDLSFRAWEAVTLYPAPGAPFEANAHYVNDRSYGDLANFANLSELREPHREVFTTDADGFRNPPALAGAPIGAIIFGSSLSAGSGLSDDQTLAAQLGLRLGVNVYNAANGEASLDRVREIAAAHGMTHGTVLFERTWGSHAPAVLRPTPSAGPRDLCRQVLGHIGATSQCAWINQRTSPEEILAQRALRLLENDAILPNRHISNVAVRHLLDGRPMLFIPGESNDARSTPEELDADVASYQRWSVELRALGLDFVVFVVPDKLPVYGPLLSEGAPRLGRVAEWSDLRDRLQRAGVQAVDLTPTFQRAAAELLPQGQTIYWRGDSHWDPRGVEIAADVLARSMAR